MSDAIVFYKIIGRINGLSSFVLTSKNFTCVFINNAKISVGNFPASRIPQDESHLLTLPFSSPIAVS